jgi:hypothetical protein
VEMKRKENKKGSIENKMRKKVKRIEGKDR